MQNTANSFIIYAVAFGNGMEINMEISKKIKELRSDARLTQAQFSEIFGVSQQAVQKWESGAIVPDIEKIVQIAKYFDVSLDALIMNNDNRTVEEMNKKGALKPQYQNIHDWEFYSSGLMTEYRQSIDEGLDIEAYKDVFSAVSRLPKDEIKKRLGDVLFDVVISANQREGYQYTEPSELEQIQCLRRGARQPMPYDKDSLKEKIRGAWLGRVVGCMLGGTVECIHTDELIPFLKETGNYPMQRYIYRSDLKEDTVSKYKFNFKSRRYADEIDGMPVDDDINYTVMAQLMIDKYGKKFTPYDVSRMWIASQGKNAYCTAERVAFCNFVKGYAPPQSAVYKNPYREWIGAQIRGDYYGYINPGNPCVAAEMAWRDASISHVKNGIYGEMFVSAMLAIAASTNDLKEIIVGALNEIPPKSRLFEDVMSVVNAYENGMSEKDVFKSIHERYDEYTGYGWCHTNPNAMIVAAALLYGAGDFGKTVCLAVQTGFDTDCNGATAGSVFGLAYGSAAIPEYWTKPFKGKIYTSIFGADTVMIDDCVEKTLAHIDGK